MFPPGARTAGAAQARPREAAERHPAVRPMLVTRPARRIHRVSSHGCDAGVPVPLYRQPEPEMAGMPARRRGTTSSARAARRSAIPPCVSRSFGGEAPPRTVRYRRSLPAVPDFRVQLGRCRALRTHGSVRGAPATDGEARAAGRNMKCENLIRPDQEQPETGLSVVAVGLAGSRRGRAGWPFRDSDGIAEDYGLTETAIDQSDTSFRRVTAPSSAS